MSALSFRRAKKSEWTGENGGKHKEAIMAGSLEKPELTAAGGSV